MKRSTNHIRVVNCLIILAILCTLILYLVPPNKGVECKFEGLTEKRAD